MIEALLDVHDTWFEACQQRENVDYLAVWLFWPDFMNSQVVLADLASAPGYRQMFLPAAQPRPLPHNLGRTSRLRERLAQFPWLEHLHEEPMDSEDYTLCPERWRQLHPARLVLSSHGTNFQLVEFGRVWVAETILPRRAGAGVEDEKPPPQGRGHTFR